MSTDNEHRRRAAEAAEARDGLFTMIAELAALASHHGEHKIALVLTAIVEAYE